MPPFSILWPTFALAALVFIVWTVMIAHRIGGHWHDRPQPEDVAARGEAALPYSVGASANNFHRLFEIPMLYFALVPLLLITHQAGHFQVVMAWLFVLLRVLQSLVHIMTKKVSASGAMFLASTIVLLAMWVGFFVTLSTAAHRYDAVMANLTL